MRSVCAAKDTCCAHQHLQSWLSPTGLRASCGSKAGPAVGTDAAWAARPILTPISWPPVSEQGLLCGLQVVGQEVTVGSGSNVYGGVDWVSVGMSANDSANLLDPAVRTASSKPFYFGDSWTCAVRKVQGDILGRRGRLWHRWATPRRCLKLPCTKCYQGVRS